MAGVNVSRLCGRVVQLAQYGIDTNSGKAFVQHLCFLLGIPCRAMETVFGLDLRLQYWLNSTILLPMLRSTYGIVVTRCYQCLVGIVECCCRYPTEIFELIGHVGERAESASHPDSKNGGVVN